MKQMRNARDAAAAHHLRPLLKTFSTLAPAGTDENDGTETNANRCKKRSVVGADHESWKEL